MKKLLLVSFLAVIIVTLMGGVALAGGWTSVDYDASHDPDDIYTTPLDSGSPDGIAIWNPSDAAGTYDGSGLDSPHGGFSSSTNRCRVCHAVHLAGSGSWRLLRDGTSLNGEDRGMDRASECNYCHGLTGATQKRPFRPKTFEVLGEHTLGSTIIPDASAATEDLPSELSCGNCHTVHGAGSLHSSQTSATSGKWGSKILRQDPNGDGAILAEGFAGRSDASEMATDAYATLSNFCGDCHNQNPNWNTSEDPSGESTRANGMSHVQGPTADGSLEVYGATMTVANWGSLDLNGAGGDSLPQNTQKGCRGCHAAESDGNVASDVWTVDTTGSLSAWPHQTKGAKLLFDTYTQDNVTQQAAQTAGWGSLTNDASRILPRMDQLCAKCHRKGGDIDTPDSSEGVGLSF